MLYFEQEVENQPNKKILTEFGKCLSKKPMLSLYETNMTDLIRLL